MISCPDIPVPMYEVKDMNEFYEFVNRLNTLVLFEVFIIVSINALFYMSRDALKDIREKFWHRKSE